MSPVVRFAPSPTGYIHVGNARTALYNWLYAKARHGVFILRFDDTDVERSRPEYAEAIERDLRWLAIAPDRIERQSERLERYAKAAARLKESGLLYPCYETSDELDRQRARQRAMGRPPVYDRRALKLSREDRASLEAQGRRPHWRFLLPNHGGDPLAPQRTEVGWSDLVRGEQHVDLASLSDPVLVREDGTVLYTFASVVDDIDMAVTHIIRGDDHVTNTGVQIPLFRALGGEPPVFGHHNLLQSEAGEGLSKRMASLSLASLREEGIEALAVASLAVLVGTSEAVRPVASLDELAGIANLDKINRAPARFSMDELRGLSAKVLAHLPYSAVAERLREATIDGGEAFWNAVRGNIASLREAAQWWAVVQGPIEEIAAPGDRAFLEERRDICRRSLGASEPGLSGPPR
jgi:glutamyl-tRNA synthetase